MTLSAGAAQHADPGGDAVDRFDEMNVFVKVAESAGFAAAARRLNLSPPTVTRAIAALEARIGAMLFARTTRSVRLTEAGQRYFDDCRRILAELQDMEEIALGAHAMPRGQLALTAPVLFGKMFILPLLREFLDMHPQVNARLLLNDRVLSLVDEGFDLALRIGDLPDSSLVAVPVARVRRVICAAPALIAAVGLPQHPSELSRFRVAMAANVTPTPEWRFQHEGAPLSVRLQPTLWVDTNRSAIDAAVRGWGVTRVLSYQIAPELQAGTLQTMLEAFEPPSLPVHLVYQEGRRASAKVRGFVDFAVARLRDDPSLT